VHRPRILFLDEPTTGLDPQSRSDMWQEVARLAREDGVTVFLTTQYLEEADALADHIGIIDLGKIVAEGTPDSLKAEIGRPTLEVVPAERDRRDAVAAVLERFGPPVAAAPGTAAVRLEHGTEDLSAVVRALDGEDLTLETFQLHAPTLDDVFLARTGRKLDPSEESGEHPAVTEPVA
jgi:ABC-2 type transport system ATP-binding protein